jgi:PAS domain S-box-containing protein
MKLTKKIIAAAMGLGILFWFLDVFVERLAAPERSWSEVLLNLDRPHDLFMRTLIVLICVGFGWLLAEVVRRSQRKLQESKESLRITLHSIGDAVIAANLQGNVTRMNPVAEELTGWTLQQAKGKPLQEVFQIVNAYTREPAENPVDEVLQTGKVVGLANHTLLLGREGREYQIEDSGAPIVDGQGDIRGVVLVFRDVTREYQQKTLLKTTLNALAHPFLVINAETYQVEIFNPAAEKVSGDPQLQHCYALGHRLDHPCSGEDHPCPLQLVKETKESVVVEHIHLTEEGESRYVEIHAHPILDYQGNVIQLVEYSLDITERKEAQKQLWKSREKYRSLVENSLQGMVIAKADPVRLVYVSPPMEEITGYTPDELTAFGPQQIQDLIHPLDRQKFFSSFNRRLAGEQLPSRAEYRFINAQGQIRWIELFSTKIDYQGEPATQTAFIDITERKKAEAALLSYSEELETRVEQRTRELRRAQQKLVRRERLAVLGQLAGGVGHELRNPLAVMSNAIYFLKTVSAGCAPQGGGIFDDIGG